MHMYVCVYVICELWGCFDSWCHNFSLLLTVKLQLQAEERGVVSIKGVCANRYLAMKEDGRLLASVSSAFCEGVSFICSVQLFSSTGIESLFGFHVHHFISVFP